MTGEVYVHGHGAEKPEKEFIPSPATSAAWEARGYLLQLRDSEPGSAQATQAHSQANEAFEIVVNATYSKLKTSASSAVLSYLGGDKEDAKDILQNTYTKAYRGLPNFSGDSQVETWLHRIMFREVSNFYRKESKHIGRLAIGVSEFGESELDRQERVVPAELGEDDPAEFVEHKETYERVMEAIDRLTPKHRKVLLLAHYYDLAHEQIAEKLGITVSASKVRLHRARQKLRGILNTSDSAAAAEEDDG